MNKIFFSILIVVSLFSCAPSEPEESFDPLFAKVRMEVQVLDSVYQIYSRSYSQIYFTTYKLTKDNIIVDFHQNDTTSCPNGWGVKLLEYTFDNEDEKIVLGASSENFEGENYREIFVEYPEALHRVDSTGVSDIIKTFAIYY